MEGDLGWCHGSSNNWDLHAVVRFACSGAASQGASASPPSDGSFSWPSPWQQLLPGDDDPAIDNLRQALLAEPNKAESPQPSSPRNEAPTTQQPTLADEAPSNKPRRPSGRGGGGPTRSKRKSKKSQVNKEVTRVPAGSPSADLWAWRKYGQKPIKGSPYPRGYYRCSTDKECKARKQVERCRADPGTLIITYTGEHSHPVPLHRNSLAGTTRSKPHQKLQPQSASSDSPSPSLAADTTNNNKLSPATPLRSPSVGVEYEDEEDDDTLAVRLMLEDTEMTTHQDDALLFLQPDEAAVPVVVPGSGCAGGAMLLPIKPEVPAPDGCDATPDQARSAMLFQNNEADEPGTGPVSGGGAQDVMLFPKPGEPQQQPMTTVSANMMASVGAGTMASVINFADDKFSVSALSAWEAAAAATAASGWGL
ncbi:hypothetical protein PR202_gb22969 [Eleusine coracana subsp. coracana]|uniref:WRKY domain-containing protein n=1 Tax=Eleusine coracana subsp. coracana TaxID=191504 RepID=A0AAV5FF35_ELECO|nr:hypothetical protein QOZ80_6BG0484240 [Eleusine coracana subsp. coracana]GJN34319.1 hypothetical protein PR202_gb22969 [Eleusine coracana subsp. coracana]